MQRQLLTTSHQQPDAGLWPVATSGSPPTPAEHPVVRCGLSVLSVCQLNTRSKWQHVSPKRAWEGCQYFVAFAWLLQVSFKSRKGFFFVHSRMRKAETVGARDLFYIARSIKRLWAEEAWMLELRNSEKGLEKSAKTGNFIDGMSDNNRIRTVWLLVIEKKMVFRMANKICFFPRFTLY